MPVATIAAVSPFYAFANSDAFGRLIVVVLFLCSIVAWSVIIEKWLALKLARFQLGQLDRALARAHAAVDVLGKQLAGPAADLCDAILAVLGSNWHLSEEQVLQQLGRRKLAQADVAQLRARIERTVDGAIIGWERRLGLLGSIVSASPFLGLLGTVWGVMMAFSGMAAEGKADINAIAPGVSGALVTTVVGLVVAIPALIGFNLLSNTVKLLTVRLDNFADELLAMLQGDAPDGRG